MIHAVAQESHLSTQERPNQPNTDRSHVIEFNSPIDLSQCQPLCLTSSPYSPNTHPRIQNTASALDTPHRSCLQFICDQTPDRSHTEILESCISQHSVETQSVSSDQIKRLLDTPLILQDRHGSFRRTTSVNELLSFFQPAETCLTGSSANLLLNGSFPDIDKDLDFIILTDMDRFHSDHMERNDKISSAFFQHFNFPKHLNRHEVILPFTNWDFGCTFKPRIDYRQSHRIDITLFHSKAMNSGAENTQNLKFTSWDLVSRSISIHIKPDASSRVNNLLSIKALLTLEERGLLIFNPTMNNALTRAKKAFTKFGPTHGLCYNLQPKILKQFYHQADSYQKHLFTQHVGNIDQLPVCSFTQLMDEYAFIAEAYQAEKLNLYDVKSLDICLAGITSEHLHPINDQQADYLDKIIFFAHCFDVCKQSAKAQNTLRTVLDHPLHRQPPHPLCRQWLENLMAKTTFDPPLKSRQLLHWQGYLAQNQKTQIQPAQTNTTNRHSITRLPLDTVLTADELDQLEALATPTLLDAMDKIQRLFKHNRVDSAFAVFDQCLMTYKDYNTAIDSLKKVSTLQINAMSQNKEKSLACIAWLQRFPGQATLEETLISSLRSLKRKNGNQLENLLKSTPVLTLSNLKANVTIASLYASQLLKSDAPHTVSSHTHTHTHTHTQNHTHLQNGLHQTLSEAITQAHTPENHQAIMAFFQDFIKTPFKKNSSLLKTLINLPNIDTYLSALIDQNATTKILPDLHYLLGKNLLAHQQDARSTAEKKALHQKAITHLTSALANGSYEKSAKKSILDSAIFLQESEKALQLFTSLRNTRASSSDTTSSALTLTEQQQLHEILKLFSRNNDTYPIFQEQTIQAFKHLEPSLDIASLIAAKDYATLRGILTLGMNTFARDVSFINTERLTQYGNINTLLIITKAFPQAAARFFNFAQQLTSLDAHYAKHRGDLLQKKTESFSPHIDERIFAFYHYAKPYFEQLTSAEPDNPNHHIHLAEILSYLSRSSRIQKQQAIAFHECAKKHFDLALEISNGLFAPHYYIHYSEFHAKHYNPNSPTMDHTGTSRLSLFDDATHRHLDPIDAIRYRLIKSNISNKPIAFTWILQLIASFEKSNLTTTKIPNNPIHNNKYLITENNEKLNTLLHQIGNASLCTNALYNPAGSALNFTAAEMEGLCSLMQYLNRYCQDTGAALAFCQQLHTLNVLLKLDECIPTYYRTKSQEFNTPDTSQENTEKLRRDSENSAFSANHNEEAEIDNHSLILIAYFLDMQIIIYHSILHRATQKQLSQKQLSQKQQPQIPKVDKALIEQQYHLATRMHPLISQSSQVSHVLKENTEIAMELAHRHYLIEHLKHTPANSTDSLLLMDKILDYLQFAATYYPNSKDSSYTCANKSVEITHKNQLQDAKGIALRFFTDLQELLCLLTESNPANTRLLTESIDNFLMHPNLLKNHRTFCLKFLLQKNQTLTDDAATRILRCFDVRMNLIFSNASLTEYNMLEPTLDWKNINKDTIVHTTEKLFKQLATKGNKTALNIDPKLKKRCLKLLKKHKSHASSS